MSTFIRGGHVEANGIRQHYLQYGPPLHIASRLPVIVIPGITSPAATWGFVGERLGKHLDTYVLDVRGRGLSSASDELNYGLDALAGDVSEFAKAMRFDGYILVGHSMGARIAARAASLSPSGVSRVVLIDPPVSGPGRRPYPAELSWYVDSITLARRGCGAKDMQKFCPGWSDVHLQLRSEWLHTCDLRAVIESFNGFHGDKFHADLPRLNMPVLLMTGEESKVVQSADVEEILALIPESIHREVHAAGHMIPYDNEAGFFSAFGDFLGPSHI